MLWMLWVFLVETENMELFSVLGFFPQRLARGSCFQHNPRKLYNTTAVQMGAESKPAAPLHPPANYLQGDRMLIKIPLKKFWVVFNPYKARRNQGSFKAEKQTALKVPFFCILERQENYENNPKGEKWRPDIAVIWCKIAWNCKLWNKQGKCEKWWCCSHL